MSSHSLLPSPLSRLSRLSPPSPPADPHDSAYVQPEEPLDIQTTPSQRRMRDTGLGESGKRRVDLVTAEPPFSGKHCLVENTDEVNAVEYAHLIARSTKASTVSAIVVRGYSIADLGL